MTCKCGHSKQWHCGHGNRCGCTYREPYRRHILICDPDCNCTKYRPRKKESEEGITQTLTSSNHPLCKLCTHRAHGPVPTYHNPAWCFMFHQGEHVLPGGQGWCAQFQQDKEETKRLTKGMMR